MLWFNLDRDEGVVEAEGGQRLPVTGEGFAGGVRPGRRCMGTPISFSGVVDGRVTDVTFTPESEQRRARSHRGAYR
jgi:hypothetical protein